MTSTFNGFGYYTNVGTTLRQGAEVGAQWTGDKWTAYANYTYIDAIYLTTFEEPSENNPSADVNGNILITNGTPIAGIPKNTVKVGVDYAVTPNWKIGADMVAASGQVLFGNENGAVPQAPGYAVFGLHTSYQVEQASADLWVRSEHFRSALLYFRRPSPDRGVHDGPGHYQSANVWAWEALRHLRGDTDHVVMGFGRGLAAGHERAPDSAPRLRAGRLGIVSAAALGQMVTNEVVMRRRQFLLTGLASVLSTPAVAQEQKSDANLDLEPVKGTEELWYLLTALDALIFCLAVAVIKDPPVIIQARREIYLIPRS